MKLYTCAKSRGFRVSWLAAEMGLELETQMLPFPPRLKAPDFLDQNPLGTIPMLVDGDVEMTESSAILMYLATRGGGSDFLLEPDHPEYGVMLDYLHYGEATLTFPQAVYLRYVVFEKDKGLEAAGLDYANWYAARLVKLERRLDGRTYVCGDRMTIADISVGYALYLSTMVRLGDRLTPNVKAYAERLMARDGFHKAVATEVQLQEDQGVA